MSFLVNLIRENLCKVKAPSLPLYEAIIEHCFSDPPPFVRQWFGRRYFELARNGDWFANSLVANATLEGYGATQIWKFSNRVHDDEYANAIRRHALDESRHSTLFIETLKLTFPNLHLDESTQRALDELQPRYTPTRHPPIEKQPPEELLFGRAALDELVQVHITEIRALILQFLLRSALLARAPQDARARLEAISNTLIRDESYHIRYTAHIFEKAATAGEEEFLQHLFDVRTKEFNDLTMIEFERETVVA